LKGLLLGYDVIFSVAGRELMNDTIDFALKLRHFDSVLLVEIDSGVSRSKGQPFSNLLDLFHFLAADFLRHFRPPKQQS
jgi:hypothetical protein